MCHFDTGGARGCERPGPERQGELRSSFWLPVGTANGIRGLSPGGPLGRLSLEQLDSGGRRALISAAGCDPATSPLRLQEPCHRRRCRLEMWPSAYMETCLLMTDPTTSRPSPGIR